MVASAWQPRKTLAPPALRKFGLHVDIAGKLQGTNAVQYHLATREGMAAILGAIGPLGLGNLVLNQSPGNQRNKLKSPLSGKRCECLPAFARKPSIWCSMQLPRNGAGEDDRPGGLCTTFASKCPRRC